MAAGGARRTLFDFILLSGGEGLSKVAGFVAFAYLARTLSSDDYGAIELAASFAVFFSLMVDFGLGTIGARETSQDRDRVSRLATWIPSARLLLALVGLPAMVALPYSDRLGLFGRYLQQLIMESIGKRVDRQGEEAHGRGGGTADLPALQPQSR